MIMRVKISSYSSSNCFHLKLSSCGQDDGTAHRDTLPPILMTWSSPKTRQGHRENWLLQFFPLTSVCALWHLCGHTSPTPTLMQNSCSGLLGWGCSLVTKGLHSMPKAPGSICNMGKREAKDKTTHTELSVNLQYVHEEHHFQLVKYFASWAWKITYNSAIHSGSWREETCPTYQASRTMQFQIRLSWLWRESLSQTEPKKIYLKLCGECWHMGRILVLHEAGPEGHEF